jgi:putative membrane protein
VPEAPDGKPASFSPTASPTTRRFGRLFPRAPSPALAAGYLTLLSAALAILGYGVASGRTLILALLAIFLVPSLVSALITPSLARTLGGRFTLARSFLLSVVTLTFGFPFLIGWRVVIFLFPTAMVPGVEWALLLIVGPMLWFRHLSLFGMSNPSHRATLPVSFVQPGLLLAGLFLFFPSTIEEWVGALAVLLIAFLSSALLLRAADRPIRREFGASGVGLIRPLLDHVGSRDPGATQQLEAFFGRHAIEADVRLTLVVFRSSEGTLATVALPTVHPGPFAAVGGSDLPRKIADALGPSAGTVFVPHTPCNHDLDLPSDHEVERLSVAFRELAGRLPVAQIRRASPLVSPRPGTLARAQVLGDTVLVLLSQAPAPSDDIDFAVVGALYGRSFGGETPELAFIDAHNSYVEGAGDLTYGSPTHRQLVSDVEAAVESALRSALPSALRLGVASRGGYSVVQHGIGPHGIRAFVIEAAGTKTAYVLIDGNNLVQGMRDPILAAIRDLADAAEVMTTDNHVVHEVDGGINAVGERYAVEELARNVREVVIEAVRSLRPVDVAAGHVEVPAIRVLGPAWTARLLTSLGDTVSVFANAAVTTFLLMVMSSLVVVALLR